MGTESVMQRSFAAGELAPALAARADQVKYVTGLRTCRNFRVLPEGGVTYRGGFRFVVSCKSASPTVQLLRYESEIAGESLLIENGNGYFRFYKQGALVTLAGAPAAWNSGTNYVIGDLVSYGGANYYARTDNINRQPDSWPDDWYAMPGGNILELPSPFGAQLPYWHQSGRVITLTHEDVKPYELEFVSLTTWILRPVDTSPAIDGPTGLAGTAGTAGSRTFAYAVTAAAEGSYEESVVGSICSIPACAEPNADAPNSLTWDAVDGAAEYYIYGDPYENGVYGFLGTAQTNSFKDAGFTPDFLRTPPTPRPYFTGANKYPGVSASYQQRRFFAHTKEDPDGIVASRIGARNNFTISVPLQDDDSLAFRLAGTNHHPVRHLLGLRQLLVGTDAGWWTVGEPKQPLTPANTPADQETYLGVSAVRPAVVGNSIIYAQARGSTVHDVRFDQQVEGLAGRDLTIYSRHLFRRKTIRRLAYQHQPTQTVWVVRDDGVLLGLTYIPEQEVWGWHRHDTRQNDSEGLVEDVCVVPEPDGDVPYVIVWRGIGGGGVRYIERLEPGLVDAATFSEDAFFVDCGLSYDGPPATTFTGLGHLEGEVVAVVGDGEVVFNGDPTASNADSFRVGGGAVSIPTAKSKVHIGLRYAGELETLDLDLEGQSLRDKRKRVSELTVVLEASSRAFYAGPDADHLRKIRPEAWEGSEAAFTGQASLHLTSEFRESGGLLIRQTDPLPLTVLGIIPQVELGG